MHNAPLYRQVYEEIRARITSAHYPRGAALPSEVKLSQEFGVSQITIRRALHELALDGLIDRRQGIGNIVRDNARSVLIGLSSFTTDVAAGRLRLVRTLLVDEQQPATAEMAQKLSIQAGALVRHLRRLDTEGDVPIAIDDVYTPASLASIITHDMAASLLFLHLWQRESGITACHVDYEVTAEMPSSSLQSLLQCGADTPILCVGEVICDESGRPLHWIISRYRSDRVRLSSTAQLEPPPTTSQRRS